MIMRPLELASRLRVEPRGLDWMFYVNAALLVLFFDLFGSRFVLAPGLKVELPQVAGVRGSQGTTTHYVTVDESGVIYVNSGPFRFEDLKKWLLEEGMKTKNPSLLVLADKSVRNERLAEIASAATAAGFRIVVAAEESADAPKPSRTR